jgi:hypothetical protein
VKPCKNRHVCGDWSDKTGVGTFGIVVHIRNGLSVRLVTQELAKYPRKSNSPACCVYERCIVRVVGELVSDRDVRIVAEEVAEVGRFTAPARRVQ